MFATRSTISLAARLRQGGTSEPASGWTRRIGRDAFQLREKPRRRSLMQMNAYLSFNGQCEAAFTFYARCLGGELGPIFRYAGTPLAHQVPADWDDKVMHASVTLAGQVLMGGDVAPDRYEQSKGFSLSLHVESPSEAERVYRELSQDGCLVAPLEKTFWADRFGMLVDRFGISWMINCEGSGQPREA